ncbi:MAG: sigma-54-dependent Fis family transcriptional regulator, partial [Paludibacteraceae bacterium]|nr:sigma-54-dependent Fis family transcriptional regulator [Paludibacteraceae bacterium]
SEGVKEIRNVPTTPTITISQPEAPVRKPIEAEEIEASLRIEDGEKELIKRALEVTEGNRKEAAARLGFSERTLYRKIKEYGL